MPTQKSVRFDLRELQAQISEEQQRQNVLFNITERFPGFFELPERCIPFQFDDNQQIQQKGFPQVLKNVLFNEEEEQQQQSSSQKEKEKIFVRRGQKSLFSQHFDSSKLKGKSIKEEKREEENLINETIKNLEIIGLVEKNEKEARFSDGGSGAHLAMDPIQQDLAFKFMKNILPRKEQQILKIFDQFSNTKITTDPQINENREQQIVRMCRERLEEIRSLYLEQIEDTTTGRRTWIFAKGIVDIFIPIRKVLDAVNQRSSTTPTLDDVEIIYLCLLWTVALFLEKPTLFKALTSVNAFCVRLAEVFLIGPEIFCNEAINELIGIILKKFLIESANKKMLKFQLEDTIAGLDAFMPFFVDLLKCFEEFSNGNENFGLIILLIIYLNNSPKINKLKMAQTLWSLQRNVVRQMNILINDNNGKFVVNYFLIFKKV
ncbi:unnamed protein product [Meloidogyne enterolobii]|uniref:Uncharacterized protein n=1 Tax=Meloidogyne enterolobii TaxID=390850 RepID=A0ACB0Z405_MELEN